jgi:hypothetical protein
MIFFSNKCSPYLQVFLMDFGTFGSVVKRLTSICHAAAFLSNSYLLFSLSHPPLNLNYWEKNPIALSN